MTRRRTESGKEDSADRHGESDVNVAIYIDSSLLTYASSLRDDDGEGEIPRLTAEERSFLLRSAGR